MGLLPWDSIVSSVTGIFGKVLDKIVGDKMSEFDKLKLTTEFQLQMRAMDQSEEVLQINDQVSARALATVEAEKAPWLIRIFNGVIRPWGGFMSLNIIFYTIIYKHIGKLFKTDLPILDLSPWQYGVLISIVGFFFGLRQLSKANGTQDKI